jgi:hypothetical protein
VRAIAGGIVAHVPGTPAFDARLADAARCFERSGGGLSKLLSRVGLKPEVTFKPPQPTHPAEPPGALVGRLFEGLSAEAVAGAAGMTVQELLDALPQDDDTVFAAFMRTAAFDSTGSDGHAGSVAALVEHKLSVARSGSFPSPLVLRSLAPNLVQPLTARFSDELLDFHGWQAVLQRFRDATTNSPMKDDGTLISTATMLPPSTMRRFLQSIALLPPTTARSAHDFAELVLALEPSPSR